MSQGIIKTSIIIPAYNAEQYLKTCVDSVLAQTQKEIEIILVDDGSTDKCGQIIREYEEKYPCVKAIYQTNQKQGAARNAGIKVSTGKYLYFLDSDDYIADTLFEECYKRAEEQQLDFLMFDENSFIDGEETQTKALASQEKYFRSTIGIEDRIYTGVEYWNKYFARGGIYSNSCLVYINADFLKKNNLLYEPGIFYEDNDWMLRMNLCAERIAYMPRQLHYRRFRAGSTMTASYSDAHFKGAILECRKMLQMLREEKETARQSMIVSMFEIMHSRCKDIFQVYSKEGRLRDVLPEIVDLYEYMLVSYIAIPVKKTMLDVMDTAMMVKKGLQELDIEITLLKENLEEQKRQLLCMEFEKYSLHKKELTVGIYGTGLIYEKFLTLYRQFMGDFSAKVFFIDTYKESEETYQGYPLYNLKDIKGMKVDCVIIMSNRYKTEMQENIQNNLSDRTEILFGADIFQYFS